MNAQRLIRLIAAAALTFLAVAGCGGSDDSGISDGGVYLNDLWAFNAGIWSQVTPAVTTDPIPSARRDHTAVVMTDPLDSNKEKIYVFGGFGGTYLNDLWSYDDATPNRWTQIKPPTGTPTADIPSVRRGHTAVVYLDKMYIFGGFNGANLNDLWEFDPSKDPATTNPWRKIPLATGDTPPSERRFHTAILSGTEMFVFGGFGTSMLSELWVLDFNTMPPTWEQKTPTSAPPARNGHSAVSDGIKMYIFGGWTGTVNNYVALNDVWSYNLSTGEWANDHLNDPMGQPSPRGVHSAVVMGTGTDMSIFGGYDTARLDELWSYSLSGKTWSQPTVSSTTNPTARFGHTAVVYNGSMFIFGGYGTPPPVQQ